MSYSRGGDSKFYHWHDRNGGLSPDAYFCTLWDSKGKAVMVWFFGGGLQKGYAGSSQNDGTHLAAEQDVIVVAPNYRTSVYGFPGNVPRLPARERNPGFLDQHAALQWVQKNIHVLGGDPKKVLIFGESAGGASVDFLILSHPKNPPFHAAIKESGAAYVFTSGLDLPENDRFEQLAALLKCTGVDALSCIRHAPLAAFKAAVSQLKYVWPPVPDDNTTVMANVDAARRSGSFAKVPVMIGSNGNEAGSLPLNVPSSIALLAKPASKGDTAVEQKIIEAYSFGSGKKFTSEKTAITQIMSDMMFTCLAAHQARLSVEAGIPTYRYFFNASLPRGATHGSEIAFAFGTMDGGVSALLPQTAQSTEQRRAQLKLSKTMQKTWADFAKDPQKGPGWYKYDSTDGSGIANLGGQGDRSGVTPMQALEVDANCALFDKRYEHAMGPFGSPPPGMMDGAKAIGI